MQAKDIPKRPILEFLAKQTRWSTLFEWPAHVPVEPGLEPLPTIPMPADAPHKVRVAAMAALIKRGLVSGCTCGCRGDFEITKKGRAYLAGGGQ